MNTIKQTQKALSLFLLGLLGSMAPQELAAQYSYPAAEHFVDVKSTNYTPPSGAYYVSPNGSTTNTGKAYGSPWPLVHAINNAPAGATIVMLGGDYRSLNAQTLRPGGSSKQLIFQAASGEKPWIKGSAVVTGWTEMTIGTTKVWKYNSNWAHPFPASLLRERGEGVYITSSTIKNKALQQVATKEQVGPGRFCVEVTDATHATIYIGDSPVGNTVEVTRYARAFINNEVIADGMAFKGIGFTHFGDSPFASKCQGMTIENCTFTWNGRAGANLQVYQNGWFKNNICRYNGQLGLGGNYATNTVVDGNVISHNNTEGFDKNWDAAGMKVLSGTNMTISNNVVQDNNATGIWLDVGMMDSKVVKNTVARNAAFGIFSEISHRIIIAGNKSYDNSFAGIALSDVTANKVYNNTCVNNGKAIVVKDTERENDPSFPHEIYRQHVLAEGGDYITDDNEIKNNIYASTTQGLFDADDSYVGESRIAGGFAQSAAMLATVDYNAYYQSSPLSTVPTSVNDPNSTVDKANRERAIIQWRKQPSNESTYITYYISLTTFRNETAAPFEDNSEQTPASSSGHPYFVDGTTTDGTSYDFRIKSTAPIKVREKVHNLPEDVRVALGWSNPVNLGAIQTIVTARESFENRSEERNKEAEVILFPNPAATRASVALTSETSGLATISVTNTASREVIRFTRSLTTGTNQLEIPVAGLPDGLYIVNIHTGKRRMVQKLMVAH